MNRDLQSLAEVQTLADAHEHNFKATLGRDAEIRTGRDIFPGQMKRVTSLMSSSRPLQSPKYITEEQFKMLMDKVEQLHLKLEHLQPVAKDCGVVGSMEHSAPCGPEC